jgi:hypothetical protein
VKNVSLHIRARMNCPMVPTAVDGMWGQVHVARSLIHNPLFNLVCR